MYLQGSSWPRAQAAVWPFGSHQLWPLEAKGMIWETFPLSRECFLPVTQPWPGNLCRTACDCLCPRGLRQGRGYPSGSWGEGSGRGPVHLPPRALTGGSTPQGRTRRTQTAHASMASCSCKKYEQNKLLLFFFCLLLAPPKKMVSFFCPQSPLFLAITVSFALQATVREKTFLGSTQGTQAVAQLGTFTVMAARGWESSKERWLQPG